MNQMKKYLGTALATVLTGVVAIMPLFTCIFMFHQPELPEEINDFRKYDK